MKLHTWLNRAQILQAMRDVKDRGLVTEDIEFDQFDKSDSQSRLHGYLIQLGTYDKTTGPTNSRHYKNSGTYGRGNLWAATYDEWGFFLREVFLMDPDAIFGGYRGLVNFHDQTHGKYLLTPAPAAPPLGNNPAPPEYEPAPLGYDPFGQPYQTH